jgi:glycerophosphoryl diester phosphodiesterase
MELSSGQQYIYDWVTLADIDVAHLHLSLLSADFVTRLHDARHLVHGSNLNTEADMQKAISLGIDQFSTDKLDMALAILSSH